MEGAVKFTTCQEAKRRPRKDASEGPDSSQLESQEFGRGIRALSLDVSRFEVWKSSWNTRLECDNPFCQWTRQLDEGPSLWLFGFRNLKSSSNWRQAYMDWIDASESTCLVNLACIYYLDSCPIDIITARCRLIGQLTKKKTHTARNLSVLKGFT